MYNDELVYKVVIWAFFWISLWTEYQIIKPWLNLHIGGPGHVIYMGNLEGICSHKNTPEGCTETHKS